MRRPLESFCDRQCECETGTPSGIVNRSVTSCPGKGLWTVTWLLKIGTLSAMSRCGKPVRVQRMPGSNK
jgi:hypothetical protein